MSLRRFFTRSVLKKNIERFILFFSKSNEKKIQSMVELKLVQKKNKKKLKRTFIFVRTKCGIFMYRVVFLFSEFSTFFKLLTEFLTPSEIYRFWSFIITLANINER